MLLDAEWEGLALSGSAWKAGEIAGWTWKAMGEDSLSGPYLYVQVMVRQAEAIHPHACGCSGLHLPSPG